MINVAIFLSIFCTLIAYLCFLIESLRHFSSTCAVYVCPKDNRYKRIIPGMDLGEGCVGDCAPLTLSYNGAEDVLISNDILIYQPIKLQQPSNYIFPRVSSETHKESDI